MDILLEQFRVDSQDLMDLLEEEAMESLARICKTRGYLEKPRSFSMRHKRQVVAVRFVDGHGTGEIIRMMETVDLGLEQERSYGPPIFRNDQRIRRLWGRTTRKPGMLKISIDEGVGS